MPDNIEITVEKEMNKLKELKENLKNLKIEKARRKERGESVFIVDSKIEKMNTLITTQEEYIAKNFPSVVSTKKIKKKKTVYSMNELEFYKMVDVIGMLTKQNITRGWYPTMGEINAFNIEENMDRYTPLVIYFANDPLSNMLEEKEEYDEIVKYCKKLVSSIILE